MGNKKTIYHTSKHRKKTSQLNKRNKPQRDDIKSYFLLDKLRTGGIANELLLLLLLPPPPLPPASVVDVITETFCTIFKQLLFVIDDVYF